RTKSASAWFAPVSTVCGSRSRRSNSWLVPSRRLRVSTEASRRSSIPLSGLHQLRLDPEAAFASRDMDDRAVRHGALQDHLGQGIFTPALDPPLERPGPETRLAPGLRQPIARGSIQLECDVPIRQQRLEPLDLNVDDSGHLGAGEPAEQQDFVEPIQELRAEG